jgi:5-methylthioadenosine/S-adenosylhomocysteine deaminase
MRLVSPSRRSAAAAGSAATLEPPAGIPPYRRPILIHGGHVLTFDALRTEYPFGDVLLADGRIVAVGPSLARHPLRPAAEHIDAGGMLVLPGLIDTHRHGWNALLRGLGADWTSFGTYFQVALTTLSAHLTPTDVAIGGRLAALEALWYGTTTMLDWFHAANTPEHATAAYRALRASGLRGVFAYGPASIHWFDGVGPEPADVVTLHRAWRADPGLLRFALAIRGPEFSPMSRVRADLELARSLGIPVTMHAGIDGFWQQAPSVRLLEEAGLLGPDLTFVHANVLPPGELAAIAGAGARVSLSPVVESTLHMGTSPLEESLAAGVRPAVSTDGVTGSNADLLGQLRELARQRPAERAGVPAGEMLSSVTIDAARTLGIDDIAGSLEPGKVADLVLMRAAPNMFPGPAGDVAGGLVSGGDGGNVDTVIVDGVVRKRHGALVGVDLAAEQACAQEAQRRLVCAAGL